MYKLIVNIILTMIMIMIIISRSNVTWPVGTAELAEGPVVVRVQAGFQVPAGRTYIYIYIYIHAHIYIYMHIHIQYNIIYNRLCIMGGYVCCIVCCLFVCYLCVAAMCLCV